MSYDSLLTVSARKIISNLDLGYGSRRRTEGFVAEGFLRMPGECPYHALLLIGNLDYTTRSGRVLIDIMFVSNCIHMRA